MVGSKEITKWVSHEDIDWLSNKADPDIEYTGIIGYDRQNNLFYEEESGYKDLGGFVTTLDWKESIADQVELRKYWEFNSVSLVCDVLVYNRQLQLFGVLNFNV